MGTTSSSSSASSPLMESSSEISTGFRCNNCDISITRCSWKRCKICHLFDLCNDCASLNDGQLLSTTRVKHEKLHSDAKKNAPTGDQLESILVENGYKYETDVLSKINNAELDRIVERKKIENDYDLSMILDMAQRMEDASSSSSSKKVDRSQLNSMIAEYYMRAYKRQIRVLCLDGGGIRGYMPIKVLCHLITKRYLPGVDIEQYNANDVAFKERFKQAQLRFTNRFDYFAGTSTGGLIAFCLAINYNILELKDLYVNASYYFKRNWLTGPVIFSKFDHSRIHNKIDQIINSIKLKDGKQLSAQNATLLDIRNYLNPDNTIDDKVASLHGNLLEFSDDNTIVKDINYIEQGHLFQPAEREKVLLITAYNTTKSRVTVFNTSYAEHWSYRIADVLKATMAAPTYFRPWKIRKGKIVNGQFEEEGEAEQFIDGGVFANDPELAAMWAIRMQWKKPSNYYFLSIGTGSYYTSPSASTWGGYVSWLLGKPFVVDALMDATRSLTETVMNNLGKFHDMHRMKFNYKITKSMKLDDKKFISKFDDEWKTLKDGPDFKSLFYFYNTCIDPTQNQFEN